MEPSTFEEACARIAGELTAMVISKQHDYGHENILAFGELGVLVRVNDKIARLKNLLSPFGKKLPKNESYEDSWRDLAGYAIIALMLDRNWFTLPLGEE